MGVTRSKIGRHLVEVKSNKDDGKKTDKADKSPAKDKDDPKKPSSRRTSKSANAGTDARDRVKRVTPSCVSNQLGKYDGSTCLETFLARFDKCVEYMGWDEEDQQFNLSVSLEGQLVKFYGILSPALQSRRSLVYCGTGLAMSTKPRDSMLSYVLEEGDLVRVFNNSIRMSVD